MPKWDGAVTLLSHYLIPVTPSKLMHISLQDSGGKPPLMGPVKQHGDPEEFFFSVD